MRPERDGGAGARYAPDPAFLWRVARMLALAAAVALGVMLLVYAAEVFLLAFAGILVAVLLRAPSDWLSGRTGLSPGWCQATSGTGALPHFRCRPVGERR